MCQFNIHPAGFTLAKSITYGLFNQEEVDKLENVSEYTMT